MNFEDLRLALQSAWNDRPGAEPGAAWRCQLLLRIKEESSKSLTNLFATLFPRIALPAASCAIIIAGLAQSVVSYDDYESPLQYSESDEADLLDHEMADYEVEIL